MTRTLSSLMVFAEFKLLFEACVWVVILPATQRYTTEALLGTLLRSANAEYDILPFLKGS